MEKPKIGAHYFLPNVKSGEKVFPQPCVVVAAYNDGAVNLVTWDENGQQSVVKDAVLVQEATGEDGKCVPCHYAEATAKGPADLPFQPPPGESFLE
jgi:hypothetical protein